MAEEAFDLCKEPLEPIYVKICSGMLSISLRLGLDSKSLMKFLSDETSASLANLPSRKVESKEDMDDDDDDLMGFDDEDMVCCFFFPFSSPATFILRR